MQVTRDSKLQIPESLREKLLAFRQRVWCLKMFEALAAALIGVLVGFLLTYALDRFFDTVSEEKINDDLQRIETQLESLDENTTSSHSEKIRRTLLDNQSTLQERLLNYEHAKGNYQFVMLELERVENKIKSLAEISVNRQDPDYMTGQIDAVADSMKETERAMIDLQFVTGLGDVDEDVPELMNEQEPFIIE